MKPSISRLAFAAMLAADGKHVAGFVSRRHGDGWMVVDPLSDQRPLLKNALKRSD